MRLRQLSHCIARQACSPGFLSGIVLLFVILSTGCTSSQENQWYFAAAQVPLVTKQGDSYTADKVRLKFYRVTVSGYSINGNAELLTGLYPAEPLHDLFGEVTKPEDKKATTAPTADSTDKMKMSTDEPPGAGQLYQCDVATGKFNLIPQTARFTVFYGVNAEAVADQVKAFADSSETGALMGRLMLAASGAGDKKLAADAAVKTSTDLEKAVKTDVPKLITTQAATITTQPSTGTGTPDGGGGGSASKPATQGAATATNASGDSQVTNDQANKALAAIAQQVLTDLGSTTTLDASKSDWPDTLKTATAALRKQGGAK